MANRERIGLPKSPKPLTPHPVCMAFRKPAGIQIGRPERAIGPLDVNTVACTPNCEKQPKKKALRPCAVCQLDWQSPVVLTFLQVLNRMSRFHRQQTVLFMLKITIQQESFPPDFFPYFLNTKSPSNRRTIEQPRRHLMATTIETVVRSFTAKNATEKSSTLSDLAFSTHPYGRLITSCA